MTGRVQCRVAHAGGVLCTSEPKTYIPIATDPKIQIGPAWCGFVLTSNPRFPVLHNFIIAAGPMEGSDLTSYESPDPMAIKFDPELEMGN